MKTQGGNGAFPKSGDKVVVAFKAHVWDCQMQAILEFLSSDDKGEGPMEFIVDDDDTIVKGGWHFMACMCWECVDNSNP